MRTDLDADLIAQLEAETASVLLAVHMGLGDNALRYCNGNIPTYLGGAKYDPRGIKLDSLESGGGITAARAQITMANADDAIGAMILAGDFRLSMVTLIWGALNSYGEIINGTAYGTFFQGVIDDWDIDYNADTVTLCLVNDLIYWQSRTLLKSEATCPWPFKDSGTCRYAGLETWCDQSWERCEYLANTNYFGGDLYLPEISERQLWWGKGQN